MAAQADRTTVADISWYLDYETAISEARNSNKNLLIYFTGSDWCTPCIKLKKDLLAAPEFKKASEAYVLLYVDVPKNNKLLSPQQMAHNKALVPRFKKQTYFPVFTVVDETEKELDQLSGYNMRGDIHMHLDFLRKNRR